jgi:exopolysaccharide biosynthesis polyprenyl glycosylphosphotransferase
MQRTKRFEQTWLFAFAADFLAVVAAYYASFLIRFHTELGNRLFVPLRGLAGAHDSGLEPGQLDAFYIVNAPRLVLMLTAIMGVLYAMRDLYPGRRFLRQRPLAWNVIVANLTALALFFAYFYLRRNVFHPRSFFACFAVVNVVCCVVFRRQAERLLEWTRRRHGMDRWPALMVGADDEAGFLNVLLRERRPHGIEVAEWIGRDREAPVEELFAQAEQRARALGAGVLILADRRFSIADIMRMLDLADRLDLDVKVLSEHFDVLVLRGGLEADTIDGTPLVHFNAPSTARQGAAARRAAARAGSAAALVMLLPLLGLLALLVRLTSRGPVFFVQERIGVNRTPFRMFKFRTMYNRAEEVQAQIEAFNESGDGLFKIRKDPRVTPVGRFLRRFSLDEIPQLLNVLRGEMTLVGPRPLPRRDFENYYEQWHYSRHAGLPGLTCLWQVSGRSDLKFHDMCILDVYYLRNQGWVMDVRILLRTVWVVLFGRGAY